MSMHVFSGVQTYAGVRGPTFSLCLHCVVDMTNSEWTAKQVDDAISWPFVVPYAN